MSTRSIFATLALSSSFALFGCSETNETRTITVRSMAKHILTSGERVVPSDFELSATLTGGEKIASVAAGDGVFTIPGVPNEPFFVQHGETWFQVDASSIDLGYTVRGRLEDVVTNEATKVHLAVDGLSGAEVTRYELFSVNAGAYAFRIPEKEAAEPTLEETYDWMGIVSTKPFAFDRTKGDEVTLIELAVTGTGLPFQTTVRQLRRSITWTDAFLANGYTADLRGTATEPPKTKDLTFDWRRSAFSGLASEVGGRFAPHAVLSVGALPGDAEDGVPGVFPDLLMIDSDDATTDGDVGPFELRDPFPEPWLRFVYVTMTWPSTNVSEIPVAVGVLTTLDDAEATFIAPIVGPPKDVKIDGVDAHAANRATKSPVLTWSAPTLGHADAYFIRAISIDGGARRQFVTPRTSLVIPPGALDVGKKYLFMITAQSGQDPVALRSTRLPFGWADMATAAVTVGE